MDMINPSSVYQETINKKDEIQMEFVKIIQVSNLCVHFSLIGEEAADF